MKVDRSQKYELYNSFRIIREVKVGKSNMTKNIVLSNVDTSREDAESMCTAFKKEYNLNDSEIFIMPRGTYSLNYYSVVRIERIGSKVVRTTIKDNIVSKEEASNLFKSESTLYPNEIRLKKHSLSSFTIEEYADYIVNLLGCSYEDALKDTKEFFASKDACIKGTRLAFRVPEYSGKYYPLSANPVSGEMIELRRSLDFEEKEDKRGNKGLKRVNRLHPHPKRVRPLHRPAMSFEETVIDLLSKNESFSTIKKFIKGIKKCSRVESANILFNINKTVEASKMKALC